MGSKVQIPAILSFLCLFASAMATPPSNAVFNVMSYGAKADARTYISKALTAAWGAACSSKTPSTVTIPKGTFMMGAVTLKGPCSSPIKLQVQGILKAPANPGAMNADAWIKIGNVNQLTVYGGGTFDGQGQQAWNQNTCKKLQLQANPHELEVGFRHQFQCCWFNFPGQQAIPCQCSGL